ncbi:MAG: alpha/beta hydrolase [Nitrososphaerota archaeon]|jgi:pimeloyl-ACP methyl ester carboxylesterase|nr:alpha/beta hydrolase [Nitrososphaerota archaeon]MDG6921973.1 alpha/beta hydrolase [Nitrososphaerota archaeon]
MPFAFQDDYKIYYEVREGKEPALVFVHGLCGSLSDWEGVTGAVPSHKILKLDLVGSGKSDAPMIMYSIETFAKNLRAVIEACGATENILVGHSMGCLVILEYFRRFPTNVKGLVFIDGGGPTLSEEEFKARIAAIDSDFESFHMNFWDSMILEDKINKSVRERHLDYWTKTSKEVLVPTYKSIFLWWRNRTAYDIARSVNVPVLIVYQSDTSNRGTFSNRDASYSAFAGSFRKSRLIVLNGTNGHFFMEESPEILSQHLNDFLRDLK